jgi:hypothetical protein
MTIEYLGQFQPNIPDVHQNIIDFREAPDTSVGRRYRGVPGGTSRGGRRRPIRSGGGWPLLILVALVVGAIVSHSTEPRTAEPQAAVSNPTSSAPTADPVTPAAGQGNSATDVTQAPAVPQHTPIKCATQPGPENSPDITLPDVVGQNAKSASEQLGRIGLLNVQLTSANPNYAMVLVAANWTVVSTNPAPCSVVKSHDHVVLHVMKPGRGVGSLFEFPWSH